MNSHEAFKLVLVAVDGSSISLRAAEVAARIAKHEGAQLLALHVVPTPSSEVPGELADYYEQARKNARRWMKEVESTATRQGLRIRSDIVVGAHSVVDAILGVAETVGADLIVTGTRGRTPSQRIVVGSVASALVEYGGCAVLVVR
ncbi:MAG TPA: universal stress protein [Thermoplasmata archaeon]|nr:universal stress protein [Thermoplasmata archaeon]